MSNLLFAVGTLLLAVRSALPAPELTIEATRHAPCNLFNAADPVTLPVCVTCGAAGKGELTAQVIDHFGATVAMQTQPLEVQKGQPASVPLELGKLAPGYYELRTTASLQEDAGESVEARSTTSFGVAPFVDRSVQEARDGGYRFGVKLWLIGDIWWNRKLKWDPGEVTTACAGLGLQWTRALFTQREYLDTVDLMTRYPMNVVSKVEGFPEECFDVARYGLLEQFRESDQGRAWTKSTLPKEEPYKAWLRGEISRIPPDQNVFEIWNEPWQWHETLPVEDFARLCGWIVEVIKQARPDAVVGPNIYGTITPYEKDFVAAGGLQGMDMVAFHPYTAGTPEAKGFRQYIRNYHDFLKLTLGHDLPLYTTEYGWSTSPEGDRSVDEAEHARRIVRESLMLYAEDVKTLIPHTMGQREQDPKDREDWFGFFRLTQEPKPALLAFANCARMIDGSTFVGDLWYGPGIGAMLFEHEGTHTLALWTEGDEKSVTVDAKAEAVTVVDLMGRQEQLRPNAGRLGLKLSGDVTYLVGVGEELVALATRPADPLNADRWHSRAGEHTMPRAKTPPIIDGQLADWEGIAPSQLQADNLDDIAAEWRLAWDERNLYLAVQVRDKRIINTNAPDRIHMADVVNFHVCPRPDRQVGTPDLYDYELCIAPTSATGEPVFRLTNILMDTIVDPPLDDARGIRWAVEPDEKHWTVEAALPFALLSGARPMVGTRMSFNLIVFDRDREGADEWEQWWKRVEVFSKKGRADERPYLVLGE